MLMKRAPNDCCLNSDNALYTASRGGRNVLYTRKKLIN